MEEHSPSGEFLIFSGKVKADKNYSNTVERIHEINRKSQRGEFLNADSQEYGLEGFLRTGLRIRSKNTNGGITACTRRIDFANVTDSIQRVGQIQERNG